MQQEKLLPGLLLGFFLFYFLLLSLTANQQAMEMSMYLLRLLPKVTWSFYLLSSAGCDTRTGLAAPTPYPRYPGVPCRGFPAGLLYLQSVQVWLISDTAIWGLHPEVQIVYNFLQVLIHWINLLFFFQLSNSLSIAQEKLKFTTLFSTIALSLLLLCNRLTYKRIALYWFIVYLSELQKSTRQL